tara:strand:+ start:14098 stop:14253 length:156 start_codon:yes stop_codon:yes gene_type:complete
MMYQIGLILILVVIALIIAKKYRNNEDQSEQLIYEDEMNDEELKELDDEIN